MNKITGFTVGTGISPSFTADALIEKAKECYSLGLISLYTLEHVTERALTTPGYDGLMELPFDWQVEDARRLAAA